MLEYLRSAFAALLANKVRAALTMIGVVIGVLAVTLLVGVGDGARIYVERTLEGIGANLLIVTPGRRETRGAMAGPHGGNVTRPLVMEDVRALERQGTHIREVTGATQGGGTIKYKDRRRDTLVFGVGAAFPDIRNMHVGVGTFVRQEDVDARRRVTVLGRTVVRELFGDESPLGKAVRIGDARYRVIGIMEEKGTSLGMDLDDLVFLPVTAALDLFGTDSLNSILTAAKNKEDVPLAMAEVDDILARRRHGEREVTVQSQDDLLATFGSLTNAMTWMLLAIASISLVVGGIGIMNIMLVSVRERTREIGVRRALGATRADVLWQFLVESMAISILGGLLGLGLGVAVSLAVRSAAPDVPLEVSPWIAMVALSSAVVVGVVSGVVPARRAALLDPVEALRYE